MARLLRALSRLAPPWRRDDWLREWSAELGAAGAPRSVSLAIGAAVHVLWLWWHEWSLDLVGSDVRYALRRLVARPAFTATVLGTLALGIGATTAMFTIVDAVMLRPLPYPAADRVVAIWPQISLSPHLVEDVQRPREGVGMIGAYSGWGFTLTGGTQAETVDGARITPELLRVLGVPPMTGQWLPLGAGRPGEDHAVLIGEGLWRRRLGGNPGVVGARLSIEGEDYTIAGVMPAAFEFPSRHSELWAPIQIDPARPDYNANFARLVGRLPEGASPVTAEERMRAYAIELGRIFPKQFTDRLIARLTVTPLQWQLVRDIRKPLVLLLVAVGVFLVIACANTAHLLLATSASRVTEIALRTALGANRLRLLRQLLVESATLAAAGAAAGLLLAYWLVAVFAPLVPDLPHISRAVVIDPRVVGFTVVLALGSALLFGLAPAMQSSASQAAPALTTGRGGSPSGRRSTLGRTMVAVEVALATTLAMSAALLGESFLHLTRVDLGFRPEGVLTFRASAPEFRYQSPDELRALFDQMISRLRSLTGVEAVGAIHLMPLTLDNWNPGVTIDGWSEAEQYQRDVNWRLVTPDYFRAMGIALRAGRGFDGADDQRGLPVAVVNDAFARDVFRGRNPLGQRIRTAFEGKSTWATVVGVVGDVRQHAVDQAPLPEMYRPFAQHPLSSMRLMLKATGDPTALAAAARSMTASVDRDIAIDELQPLPDVVDHALGSARLPLVLAVILSVLAMALGVTGIAGVLSCDAADRRPEIGLRLALGATPAGIARSFLSRGLQLGLAGIAAGAIAALALGGLLRSLLFGVDPADPLTIGLVALAFLAVIVVAAYVPASRAASADPLKSLRAQ